MRIPALLAASLLIPGCASAGRDRDANLPVDSNLRAALTGDFHGYWTGAASGKILKSKEGGLLEVPVVLEADLDRDFHWNMDATDMGELLLERSGHYNSAVWFVATQIEVVGKRIYITKFEESYEDTLCLELVKVERNGSMRFQAHAFLADPGEGERDQCLSGAARYDATLLLHRGNSDSPEFVESGNTPPPDDGGFGAAPPDDGEGDDGSGEWNDVPDDSVEESEEL